MACYSGEYLVTEDGLPEPRKWRPLIYRKCTDTLWLIIFFVFWAGLMFITGYAIMAGAAERLIFGYDSYGNVCGRQNTPVAGAPLSGQDMRNKKFVFFLNSCGLEIKDLKVNSVALCVPSCPQEQLNSLEDIQLFAKNNDSCLCVYNLNATSCTHSPKATELCPALPVPPSLSFPLFNRCVPQTPECYSQFAPVLIDVVNEVDIFHRILGGLMAGRDTVIGLCILALAFSVIMMLVFRFISRLLVRIFLALLVFGLLFVSGVMWWLYYNYTNEPSIELETEKENMKLLFGFSIISTVITVIIIFLLVILRRRIHLTIQLFQVANKTIGNIPSLFFQPLWTFIILILFWVYWVAVLLSLGTAGNAQVISRGQVEYKIRFGIRYMWWYHLVGLIWTSEFILACQQMTVAGAVVTSFFNRNKSKSPSHPVLSSISILFCYHLGTVVKGSLLITIVRVPRIILLSIYNILEKKENACARCMFKCCFCCFWCLERGLRYLNQNAYTATVINGTNFCTSAEDAGLILSKNSVNTMAIHCFSDVIIFLGKVFVVCFTVFGGLMAFNYHHELHVWVVPLLLVTFLAYLLAHSFLSVFQTIVDVLFLCFAVDIETNDGSPEKPYFMDQELMKFVYQSSKCLKEIKHRNKETHQSNEYDTELQSMTRT
ncbi:choline transporter-like protein 3 [Elgaria multicarinata webbii]|uniref:choline transporter-like protein 3 n=1 Tax=Elgaria multicarinata webbii TaxID=159646 RepID=UPI002FCD00A6